MFSLGPLHALGFAAGADGVVIEHCNRIRCGYGVSRVLLAHSGHGQTRDRSSEPDDPQQCLTTTDLSATDLRRSYRAAHSDSFVLASGPGSGIPAPPGGREPGTFSSFFTLENLREAI